MSELIFPEKIHKGPYPYLQDYAYDEECYPNFWSLAATHAASGTEYFFEISDWVNDSRALNDWLYWLHTHDARMIGFNNYDYDYQLLHWMFMQLADGAILTPQRIYAWNDWYFKATDEERFYARVWDNKHIVKQIDLYKIHHFDNSAKRTSLKVIEINMRSHNVRDLPVKPGTIINTEQRVILIKYNKHDTAQTLKFLLFTLGMLKLREEMTIKFGKSFINFNDTKVGEQYFKIELDAKGLNTEGRTHRTNISVNEIILPWIKFTSPEFNGVLQFLRNQTIQADQEDPEYPLVMFNGFGWQFSQGGMHGSIESATVLEDDEFELLDVDVESFYPRTAMVNGFYPEHLGPVFCEVYGHVFDERKKYEKGTMENKAFKLALNGTYGKSGSEFSIFFDKKFMYTITINGQLTLCMLGEWLSVIPGFKMIQANTDGITFKSPRKFRAAVNAICAQWESLTKLKLEYVNYKAMYIRDVNNYVAVTTEYTNGKGELVKSKVKRKGAYNYVELEWHKDHSMLVVPMAAEAALVRSESIRSFIMDHKDPYDFAKKVKVRKSDVLMIGDTEVQGTTRYYVVTQGEPMTVVRPHTPKRLQDWADGIHWIHVDNGKYVKAGKAPSGKYRMVQPHERQPIPAPKPTSIEKGWMVREINDMDCFDWSIINYNYYINETNKLVDPLLSKQ